MAAKELDHLAGLVLAEQAMIDEDAGELIADRLVDQKRGDRRIDAARQAADHAPLPDLRPDLGDLGLAELRHRPIAGATGDPMHEIGDQLGAVRRMHHLGMELDAVEPAGIVGDGRERRAVGHGDGAEARRQRRHAVAMAHPHRRPVARLPHAMEQRRVAHDLDLGAAELAGMAAFDLAAEPGHHGLLAIADAEDRHAGIEDGLGRLRRAGLMHGGRSAGENDGLRQHGF